MTIYVVVCLVALGASALTLFSGFGLGTLLLPTFALFFPIEIAVGATAIVHGANGLFKLALLFRETDMRVVARFGIPAIAAALVGAALLGALSGLEPLARWSAGRIEAEVTPIKLIMGGLIFLFALVDLLPAFRKLRFDRRWLPLGGVLSGFFGGLSGHQGALRAAFLIPLGLEPAAFAATQATLGVMVDASRLIVYTGVIAFAGRATHSADTTGAFDMAFVAANWPILAAACVSAFAGALIGRSLLPKVTIGALRMLTGTLLIVVAVALASGIV